MHPGHLKLKSISQETQKATRLKRKKKELLVIVHGNKTIQYLLKQSFLTTFKNLLMWVQNEIKSDSYFLQKKNRNKR
jgi:hypothetical protein